MNKFYYLQDMTQEDLNKLALERNILAKENQQLKKQKDDVLKKINFYETTEWGLRGYEILQEFRRMLGEIDDN